MAEANATAVATDVSAATTAQSTPESPNVSTILPDEANQGALETLLRDYPNDAAVQMVVAQMLATISQIRQEKAAAVSAAAVLTPEASAAGASVNTVGEQGVPVAAAVATPEGSAAVGTTVPSEAATAKTPAKEEALLAKLGINQNPKGLAV